jgi:hypothetical protein
LNGGVFFKNYGGIFYRIIYDRIMTSWGEVCAMSCNLKNETKLGRSRAIEFEIVRLFDMKYS